MAKEKGKIKKGQKATGKTKKSVKRPEENKKKVGKKKQNKTIRHNYSKEDLRAAVNAINDGLSFRKASSAHNVPVASIHRALKNPSALEKDKFSSHNSIDSGGRARH